MDYRENAGYIITDSCHVGDSEFVLGVHLTAPQQFVTWKCTGRTDYYWGHYFSDLFSAQKDLVARAQEEVQCLEEQRQNAIAPEAPPYSPWGNVQECETLCPGVYSVSTPGHGGIMVRRELAEKVFRKEALNCGFTEGAYLCFEEDCDEPVARAQEEVQCLEEQRQNAIAPEAPPYSPWGNVQECETLCPGVYSVSTPGHGGIMVRRELAEKVFRKEALNCGFTEGAYLCFEEDCDEPVALRELMDKGMYQAPVNERFAPGAYEAVINDSLQTFHAAYWQAREKTLAEKAQLPKRKDRGEAR